MTNGTPKRDTSLLVFILPFALIVFVALSIWLLSTNWTVKAGYKPSADAAAAYVKGYVIKNAPPASQLSGVGYIEVLTADNEVNTVYFQNADNGCVSDSASKDAAAAAVGQSVVAYGIPVGDKQVEVCSSAYFYIHLLGAAVPYENWKLYSDPKAGFEFKYPPSWALSTSTGALGAIVALTPPGAVEHAIEITLFSGAANFELSEWAKQYYGTSAGTPASTQVGGAPAIVVPFTENQISKNALLVKQGDTMIQFVFPDTLSKDKDLVAIPALIFKSIAFVNADATVSSKALDSGIVGTATIGPSCPAEQNPSSDQCKDKPYAAKLRIIDSHQAVVSHLSAAADGTFKIALAPGTYRIENDLITPLPRLTPTEVTVKAHAYANVPLVFDSGIR